MRLGMLHNFNQISSPQRKSCHFIEFQYFFPIPISNKKLFAVLPSFSQSTPDLQTVSWHDYIHIFSAHSFVQSLTYRLQDFRAVWAESNSISQNKYRFQFPGHQARSAKYGNIPQESACHISFVLPSACSAFSIRYRAYASLLFFKISLLCLLE